MMCYYLTVQLQGQRVNNERLTVCTLRYTYQDAFYGEYFLPRYYCFLHCQQLLRANDNLLLQPLE